MHKLLKIKNLFLFVVVFGSLTLSAQEQQNVSDTELGQFADAYIKLQIQNQESQQEMITMIEDEGMKVERFSAIQKASMDPNQESDATAAEIKKHAEVTAKIEKMQPEMKQKAVAEIESTGITLDRYQSLALLIQEDKDLRDRLQSIIVKSQQN